VCSIEQAGARISETLGVNCITLGGDRVDKKGALTGGFSDQPRSRLSAQASIQSLTAELRALSSERDAVQADMRKADHDVNVINADISKQQEKKATIRSQHTQLQQEVAQAKKELKAIHVAIEKNVGRDALRSLSVALTCSVAMLASHTQCMRAYAAAL
jgi:structural maintenance of chromosome 3 (chondroitin sulfate proteoglycan 6)